MHDAATLPDVLELLPHRYPFLLLDRITSVEPGKRATGVKRVTGGEWFFGEASSFAASQTSMLPGGLTMPNSLIVEALAQLSAALLIDPRARAESPLVGYFMGIDRVRYRGVARPGDEIQLGVELLRFRRGILRTRGVAHVDGRRIVRAELTTVLRDAPAGMQQVVV